MAVTRHTTGNSKPRAFPIISSEPTTKRTVKPKSKKTTTGRVTKPSSTTKTTKTTTTTTKTPGTAAAGVKKTQKRKPTIGDKVKGAAKKAVGAVERKPGKKAAGTAEMRGTDGKKKTKKV